MGIWFRNVRTTQERRRWFDAVDWQQQWPQLKLRTRRSAQHLVNAWDYLDRGDARIRSWKRHRRQRSRTRTPTLT
jgi:hypothetical protein